MANVYGMIQIVAAALLGHHKFANHSYTEHRSIAFRSLVFFGRWTLQTNVCGVGSGEAGCHWDQATFNAAWFVCVGTIHTCA